MSLLSSTSLMSRAFRDRCNVRLPFTLVGSEPVASSRGLGRRLSLPRTKGVPFLEGRKKGRAVLSSERRKFDSQPFTAEVTSNYVPRHSNYVVRHQKTNPRGFSDADGVLSTRSPT